MTLDEAIRHCEEVAEEQEKLYRICPASESDMSHCDGTKDCRTLKNGKNKGCQKCAAEHRQLANWLKELKQLREQEPCGDCISRKALLEEIENGIKAGNYEEGYEEYPHINDMDDIIECIKYADSVQPKPKTDVLDKIRAEIKDNRDEWIRGGHDTEWHTYDRCLQIIDKYKAESEDKDDTRDKDTSKVF